ncbi:O-antigen polymerase [Fonticella tunisiensis]|uniref:Oligosaccharide repeat unit polymerase n=1 Tax=Fonticella tunisiensis TaxID=1096341 RepID=A0A4R7KBU6_9CLOT|nr:O-antigen polymerase [Fonticella tunisiensis]TDT52018.1 oligosaccharide repeat unit polymerase [Fonticella tunisiensis]
MQEKIIISNFKIAALLLITVVSIVIFYFYGLEYTISIGLIATSIFLYIKFSKNDLFNPLGLYSVFWIGAIGLASFRLSNYQHGWTFFMWLNVLLAYFMFIIGYYLMKKFIKINGLRNTTYLFNNDKLYQSIIILFSLCTLAFSIEVAVLGFIPLFSKSMDAYLRFKISGLHYFTVTIALIPALTIIYKKYGGKKPVMWMNIISFIIPILIVSRQLLIFEVVILIITYNYIVRRISKKFVIVVGIIIVILFSLASNLRHQNLAYIYSVADMKTTKLGILTQPYLYVSMNFENLRNIIENFKDYTLGKNMLFPIFAFTNTKKYFDYTYKTKYLTNPNFNTSTYLSDIYFDFGLIGIVVVTFILGAIYWYVYNIFVKKDKNNLYIVIYSILSYCLIFSFFVPWYFNPTIWFYIIVLSGIYIYTNDNSKIIKYFTQILYKFH